VKSDTRSNDEYHKLNGSLITILNLPGERLHGTYLPCRASIPQERSRRGAKRLRLKIADFCSHRRLTAQMDSLDFPITYQLALVAVTFQSTHYNRTLRTSWMRMRIGAIGNSVTWSHQFHPHSYLFVLFTLFVLNTFVYVSASALVCRHTARRAPE
jgi:hypothetical protein